MIELRDRLLLGMKDRRDLSGLIYPTMAERQRAINRNIASLITPRPYEHLLDVCSGASGMYEALDCQYTGMDISYLSLEAHPSHQVVQADAAVLPFADLVFDHATCVMALHCSFSTGKTLQEISRVTKPNGTFTIVENGISQWICNLLLLGSGFSQVLGKKELETAHSFFIERSIDPKDYLNITSHELFGSSADSLFNEKTIPEGISRKRRNSLRYDMIRAMNNAFHDNVEKIIRSNNFVPYRKSIMPVYGDDNIWTVQEPISLDPVVPTALHYQQLNEKTLTGVPYPSELRAPSVLYLFVDTYQKI